MLEAGETYVNTPTKARPETYEEMWNFIIDDFKKATDLLDWAPYNNQYGRCTKGMAEAYLADSYMWKAYRCPDKATDCYNAAKTALKDILDNGPYELNASFSTRVTSGVAGTVPNGLVHTVGPVSTTELLPMVHGEPTLALMSCMMPMRMATSVVTVLSSALPFQSQSWSVMANYAGSRLLSQKHGSTIPQTRTILVQVLWT